VGDGNTLLYTWSLTAANPGYYGHSTEVAANPTKFQGTDFYLQVRVRRAQTPGQAPPTPIYSLVTGKFVWFTVGTGSSSAQEIVTYGQQTGTDQVGVESRHWMYDGRNHNPFGGGGVTDESVTLSNPTNWRYSGGWDTLLYHITPGTNNGSGSNRSRLEVWAQHDPALSPSEAGVYLKIWDTTYSTAYDQGVNSSGSPGYNGWNSLILGIYHNGSVFTTTSFNFDYDQVIFSKATIPAPSK